MCTVSVVTAYGMQYPDVHWNHQNWPPFYDLIKHAEEVDTQLGEPECIDPEKAAWIARIERQIADLQREIEILKDH